MPHLSSTKLSLTPIPRRMQTYVRMAEIYRKNGKFDLALENLKKAESMVQDWVKVL